MRPPEQELENLGDPEASPLRNSGSCIPTHPDPSEEWRKQRGVESPYLFIQMNELLGSPENLEWRETGRWILFEEKLDLEAKHWSSPHVPTLSLSSIWELRALLTTGLVLLESSVQSLSELTEQVSRLESLNPEGRERLKSVLLQRPQHHIQPMCWSAVRRLGTRLCRGGHPAETLSSAVEPHLKDQLQSPLWQKLPAGTEAAAVLVGELDFLTQRLGVFVHFLEPVMLGMLTEVPLPIRFVCIILGPPAPGKGYHEMGRAAAVLLSDPLFRRSACQASSPQDLFSAMDAFLEEVVVLPPGRVDLTERIPPPKWLSNTHKRLPSQLQESKDSCNGKISSKRDRYGCEQEPQPASKELQRTGRLFGGLVQDIRRKAPWYLSDFMDALDAQSFSAILYIYLATIANAITFGGLLGDATDNTQGVLESFLGTAVAGSIFCLFAGQPLTILSSTGPVLVFERILFAFSRDHGLDYLPFRLWVGIWVAIFCLVLVATEASVLVRYFTRFTEEGFCALISLIFIYDAIVKMLSLAEVYPIYRPGLSGDPGSSPHGCLCYFRDIKGNISLWKGKSPETKDAALGMDLDLANVSLLSPPECALQGGQSRGLGCHFVPDIAFFSLILFFATFLCATILKHLKSSHFFPSRVRKVISDFSMVLAILLGCGLDASLGLSTPKLIVPSEFKPTHPDRKWLVPLFGANPWWLCLATALPALLLSILVFMDQQITAVILNRKEYQLQKGAGFHLDLFWVAMLMLLTSAFGLPWYVSTTVISLAHMDSLRRESATCAPGELPRFLGIREQRLTGLVVFILTGASIFLAPGLKFIPMPVLYGTFFYMGIAALSSTQFSERMKLLLMPAKHQPDLLFLRHVRLSRIHLFTTVQLVCLGLLWAVKSTAAAIVFPLMLLGLVGIRKALEWVFSPQELSWLDDPVPEENAKKVQQEKPELMHQLRTPEINISVN